MVDEIHFSFRYKLKALVAISVESIILSSSTYLILICLDMSTTGIIESIKHIKAK